MQPTKLIEPTKCFHCGEDCDDSAITIYDKQFCCSGCKSVYEILNKSGLCDYYSITANPGINQKQPFRNDKFAFLDEEAIAKALICFSNENQIHVTFYLPQMHCSSCLWLLENLHQLNAAIISSKVNFERKEADIVFNPTKTTLRKVAELLTQVGYEPYISLQNLEKHNSYIDKSKIYKLGVAGFCFANIMLLSFPEYLGIDTKEENLMLAFRYLNLFLSLPVFFYASSEFYISAWKSLQHKFLNIDAPIVLAVVVTFARSLYEILSNTGGGYLDSMSGIVFFMLVGRVLQDKTYAALSFERDYTAYFPIAVTKITDSNEVSVPLPDIKLDDTLLIHNQELIPADGILTKGKAMIDYSFVTGESTPIIKEMGEIVYAGGKQIGSNIEILVIKEVAQSYLTRLWNKQDGNKKANDNERSFVHLLSRYFTVILFAIAASTAIYWAIVDSSKLLAAVTAVLIIACPCALLLSNTFTNGNIIRRLGKNNFYLRNAQAIEDIAAIDTIVFDKTGTLTTGRFENVQYTGELLNANLQSKIAQLASQSTHPMSKSIAKLFKVIEKERLLHYEEEPGIGISGNIGGTQIALGSHQIVKQAGNSFLTKNNSQVFLLVNNVLVGQFVFSNTYRPQIATLIKKLQKHFKLAVLSGDNDGEKAYLSNLFGKNALLHFQQKPADKLATIEQMQQLGHKVMMVGDGLNDAGALKQANVGVAVAEQSNNFTPASDGILEAQQLTNLYKFIKICKANKQIVWFAFIISIIYNIVGMYFAVQGTLSPMIAAILMPASSISIILVTFGLSNVAAWKLKLQ